MIAEDVLMTVPALLATFEDRGYVMFRRFLDPSVVDGVQNDVSHWVDCHARELFDEGIINDLYEDEPFTTRLIRVYANSFDSSAALFHKRSSEC